LITLSKNLSPLVRREKKFPEDPEKKMMDVRNAKKKSPEIHQLDQLLA